MAVALFLKPVKHVAVNAKMNGGLPCGMTTRARFQKSASIRGASGAPARVLLAPRETFLLIALSEYFTVVSFCVMTVCFSRTDHANGLFSTPGVDDMQYRIAL